MGEEIPVSDAASLAVTHSPDTISTACFKSIEGIIRHTPSAASAVDGLLLLDRPGVNPACVSLREMRSRWALMDSPHSSFLAYTASATAVCRP